MQSRLELVFAGHDHPRFLSIVRLTKVGGSKETLQLFGEPVDGSRLPLTLGCRTGMSAFTESFGG